MLRHYTSLLVTFCTLATLASCTPLNPVPESVRPAASALNDPRVNLRPGRFDAGEAISGLRLISTTRPSPRFLDATNTDLAFTGNLAIQGSYNGYQVWDISNPASPTLKTAYYCPASQSDVSVYGNLLFVSGESLTARIDCGGQGVKDTVSADRLRGLRIFDISDVTHPRNVGNVQTCRGSHTHTVVADPKDSSTVYVYISGAAAVRSARELPGCSSLDPAADSKSSLFRIEVIKVSVAHPENAAIVSSPRIFSGLLAAARHGDAPEDEAEAAEALKQARASNGFIGVIHGVESALASDYTQPLLDSIVAARGGTGPASAADTAALKAALPALLAIRYPPDLRNAQGELLGPSQCHDITVYSAIGLAGGACRGYGLLLDIRDPAHPTRIAAVQDFNFSFWHSATFNNDGSKVLFSDEWGGGSQAKCRVTDKPEWGADAIFTISNRQLQFQSYYKLSAPQTSQENCVAHNGSLIPIPGRDVMVQAWYQGGISIFDWTNARHPFEIAYFDRGPFDSARLTLGGPWSVYWYNGVLVSSEIGRGLDILELLPSRFISQNEIDAAKTVRFTYLNPQSQPHLVWPATFALARAYLDQLGRDHALSPKRIDQLRTNINSAEAAPVASRSALLASIAVDVETQAARSSDRRKVRLLSSVLRELAGGR